MIESVLFITTKTKRHQAPWITLLIFLSFLALACEEPVDPIALGKQRLEEGRAAEAADILSPVVRLNPDDTEAAYYYGAALVYRGDAQLAEWSLRRAMKDPKRKREAGMMIARNQLRGANPEEAVKIITDLLEDDADNIDLLLLRASSYAETRVNLDDALADVARVRELDPGNLETFRPEILAFLSAVDTERANEALSELGKRLEDDDESKTLAAWYCTTMALFAMEGLETELAHERFTTCVDEHPTDAPAVKAAADFMRDQGELNRAIEIVERAHNDSERDPANYELVGKLAELYLAARRIDDAEQILLKASEAGNVRVSLNFKSTLAELYEGLGRMNEATQVFDEAISLMRELRLPLDSTLFARADLAIRTADLDRALEIANDLEHIPFRLLVEARVAQEQREYRKALDLYEEVGRVWPNNEFARYHGARAAEQLGEFDQAIELYRHATRISAESTNAMTRIALLYEAQGQGGDAYRLLGTQLRRAPLDEKGELLRIELMARVEAMPQLVRFLSAIPDRDPIGRPKRLARIYRALAFRDSPQVAIELALRTDPRIYLEPHGELALRELIEAAGKDPERLAQIEPLIEKTQLARPQLGSVQAITTYLAEAKGASHEELSEGYTKALKLDPSEPIALLGLARTHLLTKPGEALILGQQVLSEGRAETARVSTLGVALVRAGSHEQAKILLRDVLEARPHDGAAAHELTQYRLRANDTNARTVDLATRAARFQPSLETSSQLRDVYAKRGDTDRARHMTEQIERVLARSRNEQSEERTNQP